MTPPHTHVNGHYRLKEEGTVMAQQLPESFNGGQRRVHSFAADSCAASLTHQVGHKHVESCVSNKSLENFTSQFCQSSRKASFITALNRK